jgi:hypothetical protein
MDGVRRSTLLAVAACAAVGAMLWLLFGLLLEPVRSTGCSTRLADGPYRTALGPAHVVAAAVLSWAIWQLAVRTGRGPRATRRTLVALWILVAICVVIPGVAGVIAFVGIFAGPFVGIPLLVAVAIAALANLRAQERWRRFAAMATVLAWGSLVIGVPASLAYAWLDGVSLFCF